jgi:Na+-driven multidrug efflux pump
VADVHPVFVFLQKVNEPFDFFSSLINLHFPGLKCLTLFTVKNLSYRTNITNKHLKLSCLYLIQDSITICSSFSFEGFSSNKLPAYCMASQVVGLPLGFQFVSEILILNGSFHLY